MKAFILVSLFMSQVMGSTCRDIEGKYEYKVMSAHCELSGYHVDFPGETIPLYNIIPFPNNTADNVTLNENYEFIADPYAGATEPLDFLKIGDALYLQENSSITVKVSSDCKKINLIVPNKREEFFSTNPETYYTQFTYHRPSIKGGSLIVKQRDSDRLSRYVFELAQGESGELRIKAFVKRRGWGKTTMRCSFPRL